MSPPTLPEATKPLAPVYSVVAFLKVSVALVTDFNASSIEGICLAIASGELLIATDLHLQY